MSLILDALNKAERERDISEGIPDLTTLHQPLRASSNRDLWLIGLAGAVVALLIVISVLVFISVRSPSSVPQSAASIPAPLAAAATATSEAAPAAAPIAFESKVGSESRGESSPTIGKSSLLPNEIQANPDVQALYEVQYGEVPLTEPKVAASPAESEAAAAKAAGGNSAPWQSLIDDVSLDAPPEKPKAATRASESDDGANSDPTETSYDAVSDRATTGSSTAKNNSVDEELARELWEQTRLQPVPENLTAPQIIKAAKPKPAKAPDIDLTAGKKFEDTLAAYNGVPFLHELPEATQNRIPSILYALHNFDKKTVVLNKKSLSEGSNIASDLVVDRILADGVLLKFKGQQFKLAALSSWVNN